PHAIYTLSLHDALPIYPHGQLGVRSVRALVHRCPILVTAADQLRRSAGRCNGYQITVHSRSLRISPRMCRVKIKQEAMSLSTKEDRKSTRLNSSHDQIS